MKVLEISLVPDYSRRLAVYLTLPVSALWLTYTCHIGLGGSSRSANGSVRLTLDISHSPCQWEVYITPQPQRSDGLDPNLEPTHSPATSLILSANTSPPSPHPPYSQRP